MLISGQFGFIFVHTYKTAGTSIRHALRDFAYPRSPLGFVRRMGKKVGLDLLKPPEIPMHATAHEIRNTIGPDRFDRYLSFTVVRNPWDWQVSLLSYMRDTPHHHQHELAKSFESFDEYLQWRVTVEPYPQERFVVDDQGNQIVKRILSFENLSEDFDDLCRELGLENRLGHRNRSKRSDWREYYTPRTFDLVRDTFACDIERFGYEDVTL